MVVPRCGRLFRPPHSPYSRTPSFGAAPPCSAGDAKVDEFDASLRRPSRCWASCRKITGVGRVEIVQHVASPARPSRHLALQDRRVGVFQPLSNDSPWMNPLPGGHSSRKRATLGRFGWAEAHQDVGLLFEQALTSGERGYWRGRSSFIAQIWRLPSGWTSSTSYTHATPPPATRRVTVFPPQVVPGVKAWFPSLTTHRQCENTEREEPRRHREHRDEQEHPTRHHLVHVVAMLRG